MTLSATKLEDEFRKVIDPADDDFVGYEDRAFDLPTDTSTATERAANKWADAYHAYALSAEDVSGDALVASEVNRSAFAAALPFGIPNTPAGLAADFGAAWTAYWASAAFELGLLPVPTTECPNAGGTGFFSVELSSVVLSTIDAPLVAALTPLFVAPPVTRESRILELAAAFHAATIANITVLISGLDTTPTPAGPLPITNTCEVF